MPEAINYVANLIPVPRRTYTGTQLIGNSGFLLTGTVNPTAAPPDPTKVWDYTNLSAPSKWTWPANGPAWVLAAS